MLCRVLGLDGQEGARTDMQRDEVARDAAGLDRREQAVGKVQAGRRRGNRAFAAGVDGRVALGVLGGDGTLAGNVGRQRRVAQRTNRLVEVGAMQTEGELHLAGLADGGNRRVQHAQQTHATLVAEADAIADSQALGRPGEGAPAALVEAVRLATATRSSTMRSPCTARNPRVSLTPARRPDAAAPASRARRDS
jgi:hypothetical protein